MTNCMHCGSLLTSAGCMRCDYGQMIESGQPGVWVTKEMLVEISDKFHDMYSLGDMPRDELDGAMRFADALRERMK